jgi:hypothetical protein
MNEVVIFFVVAALFLAVIGIRAAKRAARDHLCAGCGRHFQKMRGPSYFPGVMISTDAMSAGIEGIGRECRSCGRTYCSHC